ncbi:hypothetical protein [Streptomyces sp. NPDC004065]|uniref:hypothetical protein n=1 Tax=Streptomyces sp. NPDC004065 TaxID=3364689 RepID=UPI003850463F
MTGPDEEPVVGVDDQPTVSLAVTRSQAVPAPGTDEEPDGTAGGVRRRRRRVRLVAIVLVLVLAGAAVAVAAPWGEDGSAKTSPAEPSAGTVKVVRTDLSESRSLPGTLGYARPHTVKGAGEGLVTWLAAAGATVSRGKELYRVDDRPVPVFYGTVPLYRRLDGRNTVGRDVRMIFENLQALGYDVGSQPSPGQVVSGTPATGGGQDAAPDEDAASTGHSPGPSSSPAPGKAGGGSPAAQEPATGDSRSPGTAGTQGSGAGRGSEPVTRVKVRSGDGVLTEALVRAIKRWQAHIGAPSTGVLAPGDVVVLSGPVRVDSASAQVGDAAAGPPLKVTSTEKAVTVQVPVSDAGSVKRGEPVTVRLPDGASAEGKVAGVGTDAAEQEGGAGQAPQVIVTVAFTHPEKVKRLDSGPVQVAFVSQTRRNVLVVPVTALLALREGG